MKKLLLLIGMLGVGVLGITNTPIQHKIVQKYAENEQEVAKTYTFEDDSAYGTIELVDSTNYKLVVTNKETQEVLTYEGNYIIDGDILIIKGQNDKVLKFKTNELDNKIELYDDEEEKESGFLDKAKEAYKEIDDKLYAIAGVSIFSIIGTIATGILNADNKRRYHKVAKENLELKAYIEEKIDKLSNIQENLKTRYEQGLDLSTKIYSALDKTSLELAKTSENLKTINFIGNDVAKVKESVGYIVSGTSELVGNGTAEKVNKTLE